jgi:hypothetical protein
MIELVVTFCLVAAPEKCRDHTLVTVVEEHVTPMQLMMDAQPMIAQWINANPGYSVQRWTARRAGVHAKV